MTWTVSKKEQNLKGTLDDAGDNLIGGKIAPLTFKADKITQATSGYFIPLLMEQCSDVLDLFSSSAQCYGKRKIYIFWGMRAAQAFLNKDLLEKGQAFFPK